MIHKYRVQVTKTNHYQVDIESHQSLSSIQLYDRVKKAATREFGKSDDTNIVEVSYMPPTPTQEKTTP